MKPKRPRIMLIDDDPLFRGMVASFLSVSYEVEMADDGSDGFHQALENPPDIAVIDIRMPGWDGITTLKAFRSHPELSHVKIIILTADASRNSVFDAVSAGADEYVIKTGFTKQSFNKTIEKLLQEPPDSEQAASPEQARSGSQSDDGQEVGAGQNADRLEPVIPDTSGKENKGNFHDIDAKLQQLIDSWE